MSSEGEAERGFRAGAAAVDITPPLGCALAGYGSRNQYADDVADELYSKVIVIESGGRRAAIVTNDLISVPRELTKKIRAAVRESADIPEENILVCASHTHFGPLVEDEYYLADNLDGRADRVWLELLVRKIAGAAAMARRRMAPARMGFGAVAAGHICYNRRTIRPDGKAVMTWRLPPAEPQLTFGPKDPEVGILKIERQDGALLATLVNFGCHAVCGGENLYAVSADYPGYAMKMIERERGGLCLFAPGGAGNVVPLERGGESRKRIGEALGAAVLSVLDFIPASPVNSIRVLSKPLRVPLKPIPSVEEAEHALDRARRRPEEKAADPAESELIRLRHDLALARKFGRAGEYVGEIQALALGDIMVVGLPGEVFCEITLAIRKARPAGRVLLVSLANDCPAYFPDDKAYDQGGYEPEWTPVARGAEALLVEAGRQIVEESLRQETPLRNAAGEHGREP